MCSSFLNRFAIAGLLLLLSGCAGWRTHGPSPPLLTCPPGLVSITYNLEVHSPHGNVQTEPYVPDEGWHARGKPLYSNPWESVEQTLDSIGVAISRAPAGDPTPGRVHLELDLHYGGETLAPLTLLCGFSFTVIPTYIIDTQRLEATVTTPDGRQSNYVADGTVFSVVWLPTIVLTPFLYPLRLQKDLLMDLVRSIWIQAETDGLFAEPGA